MRVPPSICRFPEGRRTSTHAPTLVMPPGAARQLRADQRHLRIARHSVPSVLAVPPLFERLPDASRDFLDRADTINTNPLFRVGVGKGTVAREHALMKCLV